MTRIVLEENFFFLSFESKRFGISKTIVTKNMWIERKKLFQREKQNLKEIKIEISKSQLFSKKKWKNWKFWQKFCHTSISGVFFFNFSGHMINNWRWKKSETCSKRAGFRLFWEVNKLFQFMIWIWICWVILLQHK